MNSMYKQQIMIKYSYLFQVRQTVLNSLMFYPVVMNVIVASLSKIQNANRIMIAGLIETFIKYYS